VVKAGELWRKHGKPVDVLMKLIWCPQGLLLEQADAIVGNGEPVRILTEIRRDLGPRSTFRCSGVPQSRRLHFARHDMSQVRSRC
jgi:hypothetical protein